jgi:hypothetical protein
MTSNIACLVKVTEILTHLNSFIRDTEFYTISSMPVMISSYQHAQVTHTHTKDHNAILITACLNIYAKQHG